jgi:hypothetical protein
VDVVFMNPFKATAVMLALFLLRLALPLLITMLFGYGMNRLVDHWNSNIEL